MRRWNGWGDETVHYPLPDSARQFSNSSIGASGPPPKVALEDVLPHIPPPRIPSGSGISDDSLQRLCHARGQSLPDWIALRSGQIATFPDGVAYPQTHEQVRELLEYAARVGARLIPYGGGTSVLGHINAPRGDAPALTVDLSRMNGLLQMDPISGLATFGAGIQGPDLEAILQARGYTLGHFPQSFEFSTLGGWVATRSAGQQSLGYGRIEELFQGGRLEAPAGTLQIAPQPASAAGPDLRQLVLGSEGRLGILTEATVRIRRRPPREAFHALFFPDFQQGLSAMRHLAQSGPPLCLLRLSTPVETQTTLALAGHERLLRAIQRYLGFRGAREQKCMLIVGFAGTERLVRTARREALTIARRQGGIHLGRFFAEQWHNKRFRTPYLRNTLWEAGYAVDTLETATPWANVPRLIEAIEQALRGGLADEGERVHAFTHLSHAYPTGSNLYTSYLFRLAADPAQNLRRWQRLKAAASNALVAHGGTISHQHGIGEDHLPYLAAEKGPLGMKALAGICRIFDPQGIMNPGKLIPPDEPSTRRPPAEETER